MNNNTLATLAFIGLVVLAHDAAKAEPHHTSMAKHFFSNIAERVRTPRVRPAAEYGTHDRTRYQYDEALSPPAGP